MCVWSPSDCGSIYLHSARSTETVGGLFAPVSMKPQNVPGSIQQWPVGKPHLSNRKTSIGDHASFSSVYQIVSGDKTHVSMLFLSVECYLTYTTLPPATTVYLSMVLIKYLHLSSLKARMVSCDTWLNLLQKENGKWGLEGGVTGKRRPQNELLLRPQTHRCSGSEEQRADVIPDRKEEKHFLWVVTWKWW